MSNPNTDVLERVFDSEATDRLAPFAADTLWHFGGQNPLSGEHRGLEAVRELSRRVGVVTNGSIRAEALNLVGGDSHAVAFLKMYCERYGQQVAWDRVCVYRIVEGEIVELWFHEGDQSLVDEVFRDA